MAEQIIVCPHCKEEIPLSSALTHQIEEQVLIAERDKHQQEIGELRKSLEEKLKKEWEEKGSLEMRDLQKQLAEKQQKVKEMQEYELELRRQKRELEEKTKELNLEVQRRVDEERKKIEESLTRKILDEHRLKEAEKDKLISDLKTALEDAQKKAAQGSVQTQGEVLELELENILRKEFPLDNVAEIKKGVRGADILQEVVDRNGRTCGKILWESKNAEWSHGWVGKLREDQRGAKADLAVLVSVNLPDRIKTFIFQDGVWLSSVEMALGLAYALRFNLIAVAQVKVAAAAKGEKKEELYDYITGLEFKHRVEGMMEAYQNLLEDIEREKRWFSAKWAKQEKSLRMLLDQTGSFHGELQSIVGSKLPSVKQFGLGDGQEKLVD